jgi:hypothetical protein
MRSMWIPNQVGDDRGGVGDDRGGVGDDKKFKENSRLSNRV